MSARRFAMNLRAFLFMANLEFDGRFGGPESLIASPQTLTGSWANLGNELAVGGSDIIGLWPILTANDSLSVQCRILIRHTAAGDDYALPPKSLTLAQEIDELLLWELGGVVIRAQFQVKAGTVGSAAGVIESANVTTGL